MCLGLCLCVPLCIRECWKSQQVAERLQSEDRGFSTRPRGRTESLLWQEAAEAQVTMSGPENLTTSLRRHWNCSGIWNGIGWRVRSVLSRDFRQQDCCCCCCSAKSLQSCPTLCDPTDGSPPGSPVPGIFQARTLEWVAISFSNAGKWKVKVKSLSRVRLLWPHGLQPTRLLCPWDFPGKSTGVGYHCLLQGMSDREGLLESTKKLWQQGIHLPAWFWWWFHRCILWNSLDCVL